MSMIALGLALALASQDDDGLDQRLWEACKRGQVDEVRALIEAGANVDARTEFDATPLYFAAGGNHAELCAVLADAGAALDVADNFYGNTPIGMAGWLGHAESVRILIRKGSQQGIGAMMAAASNGHTDAVRAAVEEMKPGPETLDGAWMAAARSGHEATAAYLVEAGATEQPLPPTPTGPEAERPAPTVSDPYVPVVDPRPWPNFRGTSLEGIADGQHPPRTFDVPAGQNHRWTAEIPGLGHSSPVVWGDRVYVSTAVGAQNHTGTFQEDRGWISAVEEDFEHRFEVHCLDLSTGETIWTTVCHTGVPTFQRHWKASQASCTCAVDDDRIVAFFGSEGLYGLDHDGELCWSKDLGPLNAAWFVDDTFPWGYSSSPVLWEGQVFVQCDVAGPSFVACYDSVDGEELWRTARDEISGWGTPLLCVGESGPELVLNATNAICSYDPASGAELWRIRGNSKITVASPIAAGGLIFATGGYQTPAPIYAVRMGALGDLTPEGRQTSGEHLAWSTQRDGAYQPTPLAYAGRLYMHHQNGILSCYDAESGERLYRERVSAGVGYTASPVAADGFLYLTDESGDVHVLRDGPSYEKVAVNRIGGRTLATPAISNGLMLFRTEGAVIAVGHDAAEGAPR